MKSTKIMLSAVIMMTFIIFGCKKETFESEDVPQTTKESTQSSQDENLDPEDYDSSIIDPSLKSYRSSWIMDARLTDIPSQLFNIDQKYKNAYRHMQQPDWVSCSWTSYMLIAGTMIRAKGPYFTYAYPVSSEKVYEIKEACVALAGGYTNEGKRITTLEAYAKQYNRRDFYVDRPALGTNRTKAILYMLNHLSVYKTPMIAITTYETEEGKRNGHYIMIHKIDWKKGGKGSRVYYTNCGKRCQNGDSWGTNLYNKDLDVFLDEMYWNPATRGYNILAFQQMYQ